MKNSHRPPMHIYIFSRASSRRQDLSPNNVSTPHLLISVIGNSKDAGNFSASQVVCGSQLTTSLPRQKCLINQWRNSGLQRCNLGICIYTQKQENTIPPYTHYFIHQYAIKFGDTYIEERKYCWKYVVEKTNEVILCVLFVKVYKYKRIKLRIQWQN